MLLVPALGSEVLIVDLSSAFLAGAGQLVVALDTIFLPWEVLCGWCCKGGSFSVYGLGKGVAVVVDGLSL